MTVSITIIIYKVNSRLEIPNTRDEFSSLPAEIKLSILELLPKIQDIRACEQVCHDWREISKKRVSYDFSNTYVTDEGIQFFAKSHRYLRLINLFRCSTIEDAAIHALAKNCPNLQIINLAYCRNITAAAIHALAKNCPNLQKINFRRLKKYN